jgi:hypothetical protein
VTPALRLHLSSSDIKPVRYQKRDHVVVPVVLAKSDVVMNDHLFPREEYFPLAWNGVPVTVQHPSKDGQHISANDPNTLEEWSIGRIFNVRDDNGSLVGEAWIDVALANELAPGLIDAIRKGEAIDVSTGYFADFEAAPGEINGKTYSGIHRNIRPDHLAFLPGAEGACNWTDGCGIRSNLRMKINEKFMAGLKAMTDAVEQLKALVGNIVAEEKSEPELKLNEEPTLKKEEIEAMVRETVAATVKGAMAEVVAALKTNAPALSAEDQAAIAAAKGIVAQKRAKLIADVCAQSKMTKEQAEAMPDATLEVFLASLPPVAAPTYMGRPAPIASNADDPAAKEMASFGVLAHFRKKEAA